jgi:hypothetical protein
MQIEIKKEIERKQDDGGKGFVCEQGICVVSSTCMSVE